MVHNISAVDPQFFSRNQNMVSFKNEDFGVKIIIYLFMILIRLSFWNCHLLSSPGQIRFLIICQNVPNSDIMKSVFLVKKAT